MLKAIRDRLASRKRDQRGFTLVELLLVITIVGVLTGVGVTGYRNFQERAYKTAADAAWRDLQVAINLYEAENSATFPDSSVTDPTNSPDVDTALEAIAEMLNPVPDPLKHNYGATKPDTVPGQPDLAANVEEKTGFWVNGSGASRVSCVWVNGFASRFNPQGCVTPE